MKLSLKNGTVINVDNMNNRQNLSLKTENNKYYQQCIIFSIYNPGADIVFEDLISMVKDNNTDFTLTYGTDNEQQTYPGWQLSDLTEEITDEKRVITLLATKIENEA